MYASAPRQENTQSNRRAGKTLLHIGSLPTPNACLSVFSLGFAGPQLRLTKGYFSLPGAARLWQYRLAVDTSRASVQSIAGSVTQESRFSDEAYRAQLEMA